MLKTKEDIKLFWFFSNVEEKPSSAGSRKEKEKDGLKSPVGDLVEVKTSGYSKKWDLP